MIKFEKRQLWIFIPVLLTTITRIQSMQLYESPGVLSSYYSSRPYQMLKKGIDNADLKKINQAIDEGADLNGLIFVPSCIKSYINTVLNYAIMLSATQQSKKFFPIIELLIQRGADSNKEEGTERVPLVYTCHFWNNDSLKLITLLINNGADHHSAALRSFQFNAKSQQAAQEILYNLLDSYDLLREEVEKEPTQETLEKTIEHNFVLLVKKLLLKGLSPTRELVALIPKDESTVQLRKLIFGYLRLIGPVGIYSKQPYLMFFGNWKPDDAVGPISKTGILSMNAAGDNRIITLPEEVILKIVHYVVEEL